VVGYGHQSKKGQPMGFFTRDIKTLNDPFVHTLCDIYYAEQQITKNLPDMIEKATDQTLKNGFKTQLRRNQGADRPFS
jgi:ferritin-like metal-binding protein YciE